VLSGIVFRRVNRFQASSVMRDGPSWSPELLENKILIFVFVLYRIYAMVYIFRLADGNLAVPRWK